MKTEDPYNPLDRLHLGTSVADALLERPREPIPPEEPFIGAGIYALYYTGDYPLYRDIAKSGGDPGLEWPIYVGSAVPEGSRKGGLGLGLNPGTVLHRRLREHARSIEAAENLQVQDFCCRYLVVEDIWIPLGESLLIEKFSPLWNRLLDGFGNHDPGRGRHNQERSPWDVLHPGRLWAEKCRPNSRSEAEIAEMVARFVKGARKRFGPRAE